MSIEDGRLIHPLSVVLFFYKNTNLGYMNDNFPKLFYHYKCNTRNKHIQISIFLGQYLLPDTSFAGIIMLEFKNWGKKCWCLNTRLPLQQIHLSPTNVVVIDLVEPGCTNLGTNLGWFGSPFALFVLNKRTKTRRTGGQNESNPKNRFDSPFVSDRYILIKNTKQFNLIRK